MDHSGPKIVMGDLHSIGTQDKATSKRGYSLLEQSICAMQLTSSKDVGGMGQMHRLIIAALLTKTGATHSLACYFKANTAKRMYHKYLRQSDVQPRLSQFNQVDMG